MRTRMPADCYNWVKIARQVLKSKYDNADSSMLESLRIGLNAVRYHKTAKEALERIERLKTELGRKRDKRSKITAQKNPGAQYVNTDS